jgi:hypothetical protein
VRRLLIGLRVERHGFQFGVVERLDDVRILDGRHDQ